MITKRHITMALAASAVCLASACKDYPQRQHEPQRARVGVGESVPLADGALDGDGAAVRRPLHRPLHAKLGAANGSTSLSTWDRMGYDATSDNGAEQWRDVYWSLGQNLST